VQQQRRCSAVKPTVMVDNKRKIKAEVGWRFGIFLRARLTML